MTSLRLVTTTLLAVPVVLFAAGASAQNTRDCKYYGICNNQQGYSNSYNGDEQPAPPAASPAYPSYPPSAAGNDPKIHPEGGLVGPHGSQWY